MTTGKVPTEKDICPYMGACKRCYMLANVNFQDLCLSCLVELANGQPNTHGEGMIGKSVPQLPGRASQRSTQHSR
jgi:hypothetical protein